MTHPNEALVRDAYRAFNEGNIEEFLVAFAEDAVLHGADGQIEGRDAIRSVVQQLRARWQPMSTRNLEGSQRETRNS
jgi:hypothetical protein